MDILQTIHSISMFNFSAVLDEISQSEFFVMSAIDKLEKARESGSCGISGIADSLHVSSPAISRTITALEKRGFAERYIDKLNRRSTGVRLTPLGKEVYSQEFGRLSDFTNSILEKIGEDKMHRLIMLSNELIKAIDEELKVKADNNVNAAN